MPSREFTGCIEFIRECVAGIERGKTYCDTVGIDSGLPSVDYGTLEMITDRIRQYSQLPELSDIDDGEVPQENIDKMALQEPDIFL